MVQEAENINGISNWPLKIFGAEPPPAQNPGYAANPTYKLNDMIWIKVLSGRSKLDPRYYGPFIIIKEN